MNDNLMDTEPKDLIDDPVYKYLINFVEFDKNELLGAKILEPKSTGPKDPKKIIQMFLRDKRTGKESIYPFNYNKIMRRLNK